MIHCKLALAAFAYSILRPLREMHFVSKRTLIFARKSHSTPPPTGPLPATASNEQGESYYKSTDIPVCHLQCYSPLSDSSYLRKPNQVRLFIAMQKILLHPVFPVTLQVQ